ncbi:MAG: Abi family protein [Bacillota bacterium]
MQNIKPFKTIDEQLELLKQRKLKIPDSLYEKAKTFFLQNNYYRISGYTLTLRNYDEFNENISIENIIQIYEMDRRMRHILLSIIEVVEVKLKSLFAYYHSKAHGPLGYLDISTFNCCSDFEKTKTMEIYDLIEKKARDQKDRMQNHELFLKHHKEQKNDILPLWVFVELLTISDVSKLYSRLQQTLKIEIANAFGFQKNTGHLVLGNLIHCIANLRNMCAHGNRLYSRRFITKPSLSKKDNALLRKDDDQNPISDKLFSYVLVLKQLSTEEDFKIVSTHIKELFSEYLLPKYRHYGFPDNWPELL